jgi:hypothetical protein
MRLIALAMLAAGCLQCSAADVWYQFTKKMMVQPIRADGTNRVSLSPLFGYMRANQVQAGRDAEKLNRDRRNPMPQWKPLKMRVVRVDSAGISGFPYGYSRDMDKIERDGPAILVNWPRGGIAEGDDLHVLALERGTESVGGRTLRKYDGGLPYASASK